MNVQLTIPAPVWRQVLFVAAAPVLVVGLIAARTHRIASSTRDPLMETGTGHISVPVPCMPYHDTLHRVVALQSGAHIDLRNLPGTVTVRTAPTDHATLVISRYARTSQALAADSPTVELSGRKISVLGGNALLPDTRSQLLYRVEVTVPANISLSLQNIHGNIAIGAIVGPLSVQQINGSIVVGTVRSGQQFTDIRGNVDAVATVPQPGALRISGVNGKVMLHVGIPGSITYQISGATGAMPSGIVPASKFAGASEDRSRSPASVEINRVNGGISVLDARPAGIAMSAE